MSIRRLARDLAIYGSGDLLVRAAGFLTLPLYSRLLAPGQFGIWNFLLTLTFLLNSVLLLGGDQALARLHFGTDERRERRILATTTFALVAGGGALLTAVTL